MNDNDVLLTAKTLTPLQRASAGGPHNKLELKARRGLDSNCQRRTLSTLDARGNKKVAADVQLKSQIIRMLDDVLNGGWGGAVPNPTLPMYRHIGLLLTRLAIGLGK